MVKPHEVIIESTLTDSTGTTSFSYNNARQLTGLTAATTGSVSYTYDGANRRTVVGYPSGHTASYAYSNLGQLATVTDWTGRPTTFSYDIVGRLTTITRTNSVGGAITNSAYTYDNANRLTRIQHKRGATTLEDIQYTLNAAGLRTQMVDSIGTTTWAYDELNRLSSVSYPNNDAVVYGFDAVGNRTSMAENSVVTSYTYDLADRLTQSVKSGVTTSYTWDQNGNRLTKTVGGATTTYAWDALDRMTSHAAGGTTTTYTYNGDSRRVSKSVGGSTTNFAWDVAGMGYILAESGASANEFVWGGGLIAQLMTSGGTPTYAHADGLGSLRLLTDVAGNVAGSKQYDAYGTSRGSSGTTLSFGFTGEYQDSESGLIYLRARYYDPTTGRFVSQDPVPSQPRYGYAGGNPVSNTDRTGLECVGACGGGQLPAPAPPEPPTPPGPETITYPIFGPDSETTHGGVIGQATLTRTADGKGWTATYSTPTDGPSIIRWGHSVTQDFGRSQVGTIHTKYGDIPISTGGKLGPEYSCSSGCSITVTATATEYAPWVDAATVKIESSVGTHTYGLGPGKKSLLAESDTWTETVTHLVRYTEDGYVIGARNVTVSCFCTHLQVTVTWYPAP